MRLFKCENSRHCLTDFRTWTKEYMLLNRIVQTKEHLFAHYQTSHFNKIRENLGSCVFTRTYMVLLSTKISFVFQKDSCLVRTIVFNSQQNQPTDSIAKLWLTISNKMAEENKTGLINKINYFCTNFDINKTSISLNDPFSLISKVKGSILTKITNSIPKCK